jgi:two-component system CheB/CheR fusion protein
VVLRDSNDAITLISNDGSILEWNLGAKKLYGYSENEACKMNFKELIDSKTKTEKNKIFRQITGSTDSKIIKSKRIGKNGKELEVLTTLSTIWDKTSKSNLFAITEMEISQVEKIIKT